MRLFGIIIFLSSFTIFAQDLRSVVEHNIEPVRIIQDVHIGSSKEEVLRLSNSRIALADYELIRKDFPQIAHYSNEQIDFWLYKHTAFISKPQAAQTVVNSKIPITEGEHIIAHRPPEYGRAMVYNMADDNGKHIGLIDVKGSGGLRPSHKSHSNGLASLGEALREFSYEKMVSSVVAHSGIDNKVVGSYAVIDAGFDLVHADGSRSRAGLYLRQPHKRLTQAATGRGNGWLEKPVRTRYEKLFARYGLFPNENVQGTTSNDLFDFGHFTVKDEIKKKGINKVDIELSAPFEKWGYDKNLVGDGSRWEFSKLDRPWIWSHETAEAFAKGKADRHAVWLNHHNLVSSMQEKLKNAPRPLNFVKNLGFSMRNVCNSMFDKQINTKP